MAKAAARWGALDKQLMGDATPAPPIYARNAFLHGSKVRNFYLPPYPNTLVVALSK
ncbi:MAG TPA: hypothetical protein VFT31_14705 [Kribbella sp.]|nr:hypothetical protein [Kribbella sp.]